MKSCVEPQSISIRMQPIVAGKSPKEVREPKTLNSEWCPNLAKVTLTSAARLSNLILAL